MRVEERAGHGLTRRRFGALAASAATLGVAGCGGESVTMRFRPIVTLTADGRDYVGSSVLELTINVLKGSLVGNGASSSLRGEALFVDLPQRPTVFVLPANFDQGSVIEYWEHMLVTSFGVDSGIGSLDARDLAKLRAARGRTPLMRPNGRYKYPYPIFCAFGDPRDPKSLIELDPKNLGAKLPGVAMKSFDVEITDAPITKGALVKKLPWIMGRPSVAVGIRLPGPEVGRYKSADDIPLEHRLRNIHFFGRESRP
jgi:hypothetical protein